MPEIDWHFEPLGGDILTGKTGAFGRDLLKIGD
jgi:hypothetical protein